MRQLGGSVSELLKLIPSVVCDVATIRAMHVHVVGRGVPRDFFLGGAKFFSENS